MDKIREIETEISKHRKLLNRAIGNHIIPYINYHHYEIVRLIGELNDENDKIKEYISKSIESVIGVQTGNDLMKQYLDAEDEAILTGNFREVSSQSVTITEKERADIFRKLFFGIKK